MGRSMVDLAYGVQQTLTSLLRNFVYTADYNTDLQVRQGCELRRGQVQSREG